MTPREFNRLLSTLATNRESLRVLYEFYFPKIVLFVSRKYAGKVDGADVAQELFLYLMRKENHSYVENPSAYIYTAASNIAYKSFSHYGREQELTDVFSAPEASVMDVASDRSELEQAMNALDTDTRKIINMHVTYGYSLKEIAEESGDNYSTVRNKYNRALKTLKKIITELRDKNGF